MAPPNYQRFQKELTKYCDGLKNTFCTERAKIGSIVTEAGEEETDFAWQNPSEKHKKRHCLAGKFRQTEAKYKIRCKFFTVNIINYWNNLSRKMIDSSTTIL